MLGRDLALVAAGGALGASARYGVAEALPVAAGSFPLSTFLVNVVGAFALGAVLEWTVRRSLADHWVRFLVGVGTLGAFTTFSTFGVELAELIRDGNAGLAIGYAAASLAAGLAAVVGGLVTMGWRGQPPLPTEGES